MMPAALSGRAEPSGATGSGDERSDAWARGSMGHGRQQEAHHQPGSLSQGVSSSYQISLKRLSLWTSNSCPYLGPAQALIGFWNNSSPTCWEPGGQATLPTPRPSSVWVEMACWGMSPKAISGWSG